MTLFRGVRLTSTLLFNEIRFLLVCGNWPSCCEPFASAFKRTRATG